MLRVKVCGMKYPDNILDVLSLNPDYLGFIFYDKSPRYVGDLSQMFIKNLTNIKKVGVFVNDTLPNIQRSVSAYGLDVIQLHGNEHPAFVDKVKTSTGVLTIKAFGIAPGFNWSELDAYKDNVDYFLFDTRDKAYGGTGLRFDWNLLNGYTLDKPYFLSGGISEKNIADVYKLKDQRLFAVDVNSRFELSPGIKDVKLLQSVFDY
ncbi:phosphoribosylanthranilate isomerase [Olivibacter sp. SDN3]|uniref:phosphoribosylanthranilate isomerase n=1 Tax=Olivibacter sp. SDN3 TaxID=2764720 RepID=UPI001651255B|nr:phosphoribosylanthranilate isomerase [Olivibacter sp. SDN3]QNL48929.1 phosphoribosylanthranilate isomerase [Olivibacter sp. SDN3]